MGEMSVPRYGESGTRLNDGSVLLAGGVAQEIGFVATSAAESYQLFSPVPDYLVSTSIVPANLSGGATL
jgi:hypothetical protein